MHDFQDKIDPRFTYDDPFNEKCLYCSGSLKVEWVDQISKVPFKLFYKHFLNHVKIMKELHGRFKNEYFEIDHSLHYKWSHVKRCLQCGWWSCYDEYLVSASWQIWRVFYGVSGVIKNVDLNDLSVPDLEIRNHLARHYDSRFQVNPRKFENVASGIFKDLGFQALCTPYSHDGGIDILLEKDNDISAVQVKRTKNSIKLEQVRSFLGALIIKGVQRGIYVSTSEFQKGCYNIASSSSITLFGGSRFYESLLEAQIIRYSSMEFPTLETENLFHCGCFEMNSL